MGDLFECLPVPVISGKPASGTFDWLETAIYEGQSTDMTGVLLDIWASNIGVSISALELRLLYVICICTCCICFMYLLFAILISLVLCLHTNASCLIK